MNDINIVTGRNRLRSNIWFLLFFVYFFFACLIAPISLSVGNISNVWVAENSDVSIDSTLPGQMKQHCPWTKCVRQNRIQQCVSDVLRTTYSVWNALGKKPIHNLQVQVRADGFQVFVLLVSSMSNSIRLNLFFSSLLFSKAFFLFQKFSFGKAPAFIVYLCSNKNNTTPQNRTLRMMSLDVNYPTSPEWRTHGSSTTSCLVRSGWGLGVE